MEHSLEKNGSISSCRFLHLIPCLLPRFDHPTGACPTHRRQWADMTLGLLKTWKDTDHRRCKKRLVRNATFFEQNFHMHSA